MMKNKVIRKLGVLLSLFLVLVYVLVFLLSPNNLKEPITNMQLFYPYKSDSNEFISLWDTTKTSLGSTNSSQLCLPLESEGTYNFTVFWGDGLFDEITNWNQSERMHNYDLEGVYTITITRMIKGWRFNNEGDKLKIIGIQQWGCLQLGNLGGYFYGCENLELTTTDNLNLTGTTNLFQAFKFCSNLGNYGDLNGWNTVNVTNMSEIFYGATTFNQPIGNWNTSSVTNMWGMFSGAFSFNQPIDNWDVSRVINMGYMFSGVIQFPGSIEYGITSFNQPLNNWDVSNVKYMNSMFWGASSFNHPINNWNTLDVITMAYMFTGASSFNQPIGNWDVSNVKYMSWMFKGASSFNQDIGSWDVSSVRQMDWMFDGASSFNQPIGTWNTSEVRNVIGMFNGATSFNQPIGTWDVSLISDMSWMFASASSFNQDIGSWNVSNVRSMDHMFYGVTLSTPNYDNLILGWSQLQLQAGVSFDGGNSMYSAGNPAKARANIISSFNWTIHDGGIKSEETISNEMTSFIIICIFSVLIGTILVKKRSNNPN